MPVVRLGLGVAQLPFATAEGFWRWVDLCEQGGVDSLWQSDRVVTEGPFLEPVSAMAALAGRTKRLKFGMNVVALAFREPVGLAKACATIDYLSGGRLLPGFGIGAPTSPDWRALAVPSAERGSRADEALEIMTRLWTGERVTFEGRHYRCEEAIIRPLPVQQPLPVWLGGSSPGAIRRTGRFADGWHAGAISLAEAARVVAQIHEAAAAAGRRIDDDHFGATLFFTAEEAGRETRRARLAERYPARNPDDVLACGLGELTDLLSAYEAVGITKFILHLLADDEDDLMRQTRRLIDEVLPKVHRPKTAAALA